MLRAVLSGQGRTHAAEASYNNHWGVPLTLARMPADTDFAVIEIGMNHPGEIAPLARLARLDVAMITTVAAGASGGVREHRGDRPRKGLDLRRADARRHGDPARGHRHGADPAATRRRAGRAHHALRRGRDGRLAADRHPARPRRHRGPRQRGRARRSCSRSAHRAGTSRRTPWRVLPWPLRWGSTRRSPPATSATGPRPPDAARASGSCWTWSRIRASN